MYITEYFSLDRRRYAVQGEEAELKTFRQYTLSLALGTVAARRRLWPRPNPTPLTNNLLSMRHGSIGGESVDLLHQLFIDETARNRVRQEELMRLGIKGRLSALAVEQELTILEQGTDFMNRVSWINHEGYKSSLRRHSGAIALEPCFQPYERPEAQIELTPEHRAEAHAKLRAHGTSGMHFGRRHALNGNKPPLVVSAAADLVYGKFDEQRQFQPLVVIPYEEARGIRSYPQ